MNTNVGPYNYTIGTGAIIFSENGGSILLLEEYKAPGRWGIAGGKLEPMPSLDNVTKEVLEETGYRVRIDGLVHVYQRYDRDPQTISFIYRATVLNRQAEPDASEVISTRWFKLADVPWERLRFEDNRIMIQDAIKATNPFPSAAIKSLPASTAERNRDGNHSSYSQKIL